MAVDSGTYTDQTLASRRRLAEAMMHKGMDASPISSPWQGLSRVASAMMGGYGIYRADQEQKEQEAQVGRALADNLVGVPPGSPSAATTSPRPDPHTRIAGAMLSADSRGGGGDYVSFVKKQEGFTPTPKWDFKQHSSGYGTRAQPGEAPLSEPEADRRLRTELSQARQLVQGFGAKLSPKQEDALTDLTFNSGTKWMTSGLGEAVRAGDWARAQQLFQQYVNAGGKPLPSLVARRQAAAPWLADTGSPQPEMMAEGGLPVPPQASPMMTGATPQAPVQMAQAPGQTMTDAQPEFALPPRVQAQVRALLANPRTRAAGMSLFDRYHENWMKRNGDPLDRQIREAQLAQYSANTEKLRADAEESRRKANLAPGAFKDPKQLADVEESIRKEYKSYAKPYLEVRDAYGRIQQAAGNPSAAGDLALIFNFMKMLDPGSVVREGEFATAQNAAGVDDRIKNIWNRLVSGERLNPSQRADFVGQAEGLYGRMAKQYLATQEQYRGIAQRMGLDPRNVIVDYEPPGDALKKQDRLPQADPQSRSPAASPNAAPAAPAAPRAATEAIGSTRNIGGRLYQKTLQGWVPVQPTQQAAPAQLGVMEQ